MWEFLAWKVFTKKNIEPRQQQAVKTFRKHQNAANPIPFFLKDRNEISKKLGGRRDQIFKKSSGETKQDGKGEGGREQTKVCGGGHNNRLYFKEV